MQVNSNRIIYKRKLLNQSLTDIWTYPLTVVEAPMGYGKTTAVREFLKASDAQVLWQTYACRQRHHAQPKRNGGHF